MSEATTAVIALPPESLVVEPLVVEHRVPARIRARSAVTEPVWVQVLLVLGALGFLLSFLLLPLLLVFVEALRGGWLAFVTAISEPDALAAVKLTLAVTAIVVPVNLLFGVAAA